MTAKELIFCICINSQLDFETIFFFTVSNFIVQNDKEQKISKTHTQSSDRTVEASEIDWNWRKIYSNRKEKKKIVYNSYLVC